MICVMSLEASLRVSGRKGVGKKAYSCSRPEYNESSLSSLSFITLIKVNMARATVGIVSDPVTPRGGMAGQSGTGDQSNHPQI